MHIYVALNGRTITGVELLSAAASFSRCYLTIFMEEENESMEELKSYPASFSVFWSGKRHKIVGGSRIVISNRFFPPPPNI
jgi:hypothetical protein